MIRQLRTDQNAGEALDLAVGDELLLDLPQISGTGYVWSIEQQPAGLALAGDEMEVADLMPGAGGRRRLLFRVIGRGEGELALHLGRPWPGGEVERTLSYPVRLS